MFGMILKTPVVLIILSLDRLLEYMGSYSYIPVCSPYIPIVLFCIVGIDTF